MSVPVAAAAGMTKEALFVAKAEIGALMVPPPCDTKVICGPVPLGSVRLLPVRVMSVPAVPDFGLKSEIVGGGNVTIAVVLTVLVPVRPSSTVRLTVKVPAAL